MKKKILGRLCGIYQASIFGYGAYISYEYLIEHIELNNLFNNQLINDNPLEIKLLTGAYLIGNSIMAVASTAFMSACGVGVVDGLVDVAKGTHHYFGLKIWKTLTKNEERKRNIDKSIEDMLYVANEPIIIKKES